MCVAILVYYRQEWKGQNTSSRIFPRILLGISAATPRHDAARLDNYILLAGKMGNYTLSTLEGACFQDWKEFLAFIAVVL